jgi:MOSC domain-containing protein
VRIAELWRFPVKSLQGERLGTAELGPLGLRGDRQWALFDLDTGFGLTARRVPDLLFAGARIRDGGVEAILPDGTVTADDAVLSAWLGRPVALRPAAGLAGAPRYEGTDDEDERTADWEEWEGAEGAFHDNADFRVSLVSTGTLGSWERRRFRANVLLDGEGEDGLVGARVRLGTAELAVVEPIARCVMVTRPQPGGIGRANDVLKTVHRERGGLLAIGAGVVVPGTVAIGDVLEPRD